MNILKILGDREMVPNQLRSAMENSLEDSFVEGKSVLFDNPLPPSVSSTIAIAMSCDGQTFATTHGDHTVKVFAFISGAEIRVFRGHPRTPWTIKYHPSNPNIVASGCLGFEVRVWDIAENLCVSQMNYNYSIISLAFHPHGQYLAVASGARIELWDWQKPTQLEGGTTINSTEPATDNRQSRGPQESGNASGNGNSNSGGNNINSAYSNDNRNNRCASSRLSVKPNTISLTWFSISHTRNIRAVLFHPSGDYLFAAAPDTPKVPLEVLTHCRLYAFKFSQLFDTCSCCCNSYSNVTLAENEVQQVAAVTSASNRQRYTLDLAANSIIIVPQIHLYSDGGIDISQDGNYLFTCAHVHVPPILLDLPYSRTNKKKHTAFSPQSHTEQLYEDISSSNNNNSQTMQSVENGENINNSNERLSSSQQQQQQRRGSNLVVNANRYSWNANQTSNSRNAASSEQMIMSRARAMSTGSNSSSSYSSSPNLGSYLLNYGCNAVSAAGGTGSKGRVFQPERMIYTNNNNNNGNNISNNNKNRSAITNRSGVYNATIATASNGTTTTTTTAAVVGNGSSSRPHTLALTPPPPRSIPWQQQQQQQQALPSLIVPVSNDITQRHHNQQQYNTTTGNNMTTSIPSSPAVALVTSSSASSFTSSISSSYNSSSSSVGYRTPPPLPPARPSEATAAAVMATMQQQSHSTISSLMAITQSSSSVLMPTPSQISQNIRHQMAPTSNNSAPLYHSAMSHTSSAQEITEATTSTGGVAAAATTTTMMIPRAFPSRLFNHLSPTVDYSPATISSMTTTTTPSSSASTTVLSARTLPMSTAASAAAITRSSSSSSVVDSNNDQVFNGNRAVVATDSIPPSPNTSPFAVGTIHYSSSTTPVVTLAHTNRTNNNNNNRSNNNANSSMFDNSNDTFMIANSNSSNIINNSPIIPHRSGYNASTSSHNYINSNMSLNTTYSTATTATTTTTTSSNKSTQSTYYHYSSNDNSHKNTNTERTSTNKDNSTASSSSAAYLSSPPLPPPQQHAKLQTSFNHRSSSNNCSNNRFINDSNCLSPLNTVFTASTPPTHNNKDCNTNIDSSDDIWFLLNTQKNTQNNDNIIADINNCGDINRDMNNSLSDISVTATTNEGKKQNSSVDNCCGCGCDSGAHTAANATTPLVIISTTTPTNSRNSSLLSTVSANAIASIYSGNASCTTTTISSEETLSVACECCCSNELSECCLFKNSKSVDNERKMPAINAPHVNHNSIGPILSCCGLCNAIHQQDKSTNSSSNNSNSGSSSNMDTQTTDSNTVTSFKILALHNSDNSSTNHKKNRNHTLSSSMKSVRPADSEPASSQCRDYIYQSTLRYVPSKVRQKMLKLGRRPTGWVSEEHLSLFRLNFSNNGMIQLPTLVNSRYLPGALMKAVTSAKLSSTCRYALIGYGVRVDGEVQDHPNRHAACEIISLHDSNFKTVTVMKDVDDEVNIAQFHPYPGHGIVYGTKRGKIRTFSMSSRGGK